MGLFSKLLERDLDKAIKKYEAANKRVEFSTSSKKKNNNFLVKTVGFINRYDFGRDVLTPPEYDFEEIKRAAETDSYIQRINR